jgi:GNAT superfamily N-acetyltransferase
MQKLTYYIEEFDPPTAPDDLFILFFNYLNHRFRILYPDDPIPSRELTKKQMQNPHPHYKNHYWIVFDETKTRIIGSASLGYELESSPSYKDNKHTCWGNVVVTSENRKKGIGTSLISNVLQIVKDEGKTIFHAGSSEKDGLEFLKSLELGIVAMNSAENRLYLDKVDWPMLQKWITDGPTRANGVLIEKFCNVPENDLKAYTDFYTELLNLVPKEGIEWEANVTPESRRLDEKRTKERDTTWLTLVTREPNGELSGMTEMFYNKANPHLIQQELTGVRPKYRGRGLGKWLKAQMLYDVRDKYPDLKYVVTGNANSNAPMLAIDR